MQKIIFTDLDGTLLDHDTYSYAKAKQALSLIKKNKVPLIICTSKTRAEIETYQKKLGNKDPFISENGGAIFIPKNYFDFSFKYDKEDSKYLIIKLGTEYRKLVDVMKKIKKNHEVRCFNEMTSKELAKEANLNLNEAKLAKQREFDEVFTILNSKQKTAILKEIKKAGFNYTIGDRYYHIMGNSDKGKAVKILLNLFRKQYGKITTIAIGDSRNDFEMLNAADKPYLVKNKNNKYASTKYSRAGGIGPDGVNRAIKKEIGNG